MFDDHGARPAIVPHQPVVVADMNQQHSRIIDRMAGIDSAGFGRVVFQVDPGQPALLGTQDLELVLEVVLWRLVDDEVQFQIAYLFSGYFAHITVQVEGWAATAVAFGATRFDWQVPVMVDASKGIQIAAVDWPGGNVQTPHGTVPFASRFSATAMTISGLIQL